MADRRQFIIRSFVTGAAASGAFATPSQAQLAQAQTAAKAYMCAFCGCTMDGQEFSAPGTCPACGMKLIEKAADIRLKVAILVFDDVQIIDFAAPHEVFGQASFNVFTVGETGAPLTTVMGLHITPTYSFATCPRPDVLLVPGGGIIATLHNNNVLDFIRARAAQASYVMSVCNGALILAQTGLLDGLTATTFYGVLDKLAADYPKVKVVSDRRWTDNGKFITTAGLSAGIDGALHVVSRLKGLAAAQITALNMEYNWRPEGDYARPALADYPLRTAFGARLQMSLPENYRASLESTAGDRKSWHAAWRVESDASDAVLASAIAQALGRSLRMISEAPHNGPQRRWRYTDTQGRNWRIRLSVAAADAGVKRAEMDVTLIA